MMLRNDKRLPDLGLAVQPGYPRILAICQLYDVTRFSCLVEYANFRKSGVNFGLS